MLWFSGRRLNLKVIRYHARTIFLGPLIVGAAAMYFFAVIPQAREVYLGIIEDQRIVQGLLGLALIGLLCLLLDCWQHMLGTNAINRMYVDHGDIYVDRSLLALRNWLGRISAFFPLIGLGAGLVFVTIDAEGAGARFSQALVELGGNSKFPEFADTLNALPNFTFYVGLTFLFVGLPAFIFLRYVKSHRERTILRGLSLRRLVMWAGVVISVAAIVAPLACQDCVVGAAQGMGPLAGAAIALIALVSLLMGLSYLSSIARFPITGAAVTLLLGWMVWQTYFALSPRRVEAVRAPQTDRGAAHRPDQLLKKFDDWLAVRQKADGAAFARYPVFIVSAQGGGIYATAASSAFLAAMQDQCPNFAQHIFAISAVSGGAVGAALFAATAPGKLAGAAGCGNWSRTADKDSLSTRSKEVVRKDHLSPALALIWPDIARKVFLSPDPAFDRSSVLERSFACAFDPPRPWPACGSASGKDGAGLRMPFDGQWRVDAPAPALILAATWVETGFRAAFAPFPLHAISDGTLDSFYKSKDGKGDFATQGIDINPSLSLIEAAFVSARFPGIVPSWRQYAQQIGRTDQKLWNFVDGGYVDNSGATTAHELYEALAKHVKEGGLAVDLHLVLLTDANTDPDFSTVEDGTRFSDVVAPATALLSVRGQLAFRAVTRAIDEIEPNAHAEDLAGRGRPSKVLAVNLHQDSFQLPLGWKISRITDDIVRLMLGRPDLCDTKIPEDARPNDVVRVIRDNSCVKKRIVDLLSAAPSP